MAKLTYWCAPILTDARCYNIRTKTKKEAVRLVALNTHQDYEAVRKVTVYYKDAFDLAVQCQDECGTGE